MRVKFARTERRWRREAEALQEDVNRDQAQIGRLVRELAAAEKRARDAEGRPAPVIPTRLVLEWSDGSQDHVDVRTYIRPRGAM